MKREEFIKKSYRTYMMLYSKRLEEECMLLAVDFESELFTIQLLDDSNHYMSNKFNEFQEHISLVDFPKKINKIKIVK